MGSATIPHLRVSRRERGCDCCGRIAKGERYLRWRWFDGRDALSLSVHLACMRLLRAIWNEGCLSDDERTIEPEHVWENRRNYRSRADYARWVRQTLERQPDAPSPWNPILTQDEIDAGVARELAEWDSEIEHDETEALVASVPA